MPLFHVNPTECQMLLSDQQVLKRPRMLWHCSSSSSPRKRDISADALAGYSRGVQLDTKQEGVGGLPTDK